MQSKRFSIADRIRSFKYAVEGIIAFVNKEHNAWLHFIATVVVVCAGFYFNLSGREWIAIVFAIALVWIAEMLNTCIEHAMDFISAERNNKIKFIKDVASGAVLIAAIAAVIIGSIVFIPHFNI